MCKSFARIHINKGEHMKKTLALLFLFASGCAALIDPANHGTAYMKREWAKVPAGVVEMCDRRADEEGFKAGRQAYGLVTCEDSLHCKCVIGFYRK
jgi:hypothetical protein